MSRPRSKSFTIVPKFIVVIAISLWVYDAYTGGNFSESSDRSTTEKTENRTSSNAEPDGKNDGSEPARTGNYDTYRNCTLTSDHGNDGDSFRVKFPDGRNEILRLYFVDSPESAFKTYVGGQSNEQRIMEQAAEMGRITPVQAVEIGKNAKDFTLTHLSKAPFDVHTEWDSPFNDKRYHAFIELSYNGNTRFLHELLVEKGYARIHTKGAQLPDGTSERKQEDYLYRLEKAAKSANAGAWGM